METMYTPPGAEERPSSDSGVGEAQESPAEAAVRADEPDSDPEPLIIEAATPQAEDPDRQLKALLEGVVYVTDEPLSAAQIAAALELPVDKVKAILEQLVAEYSKPGHGLTVRQVAGGYQMTTKPEHHDAIRAFVKRLTPPLKLSLAALETLAVVAYKQPITAPEVMEIRGVQGAGVLKTLLERKLIVTSGRKNVIGRPILYKTTKEFLVQFGLKDLSELPTPKEFEELGRLALSDDDLPEETSLPGEGPGHSEPNNAAVVSEAEEGMSSEGESLVSHEEGQ